MDNHNETDMAAPSVTNEDVLLVIKIIKKALEYRPQLAKEVTGKAYLALSDEERAIEDITPRIAIHYADEARQIPILFFRFVGDGIPIVEAFFYPMEAVYSFLTEARNIVRHFSPPERSVEEIEKVAFEHVIDMTLIMFDNFYQRAGLMMDSFTEEVIEQWRRQKSQDGMRHNAEQGIPPVRYKEKFLEKTVEYYAKQVLNLWKFQGQTRENWRKINLAIEYEAIYKHWRRLGNLSSDDDWRFYAKVEKFKDTPDDLLDKLANTDRFNEEEVKRKISELALEHAARRVSLIKKDGVGESIYKKRRDGIKVTGYSIQQLFNFLKEGRELKAQIEAAQQPSAQGESGNSLDQDSDSALTKKAKLLEQNINFVKEHSAQPQEQNQHSTQTEKT